MFCDVHALAARLRSQSGNTMLLMPVAVLVLLLLAAIAVDAAVLFLGQRRIADLAASVSHDAVSYVDLETFYQHGEVRLDRDQGVAREAVLSSQLPHDDALVSPSCGLTTGQRDGEPFAEADCSAQVRLIFAPALPGADRIRQVTASDTAVGLQDG